LRQRTSSTSLTTTASELKNTMRGLVTALQQVSFQSNNQRRGRGRGRGRYIECWNCGEPRHVRMQCTHLESSRMFHQNSPCGQHLEPVNACKPGGIVTVTLGANWPKRGEFRATWLVSTAKINLLNNIYPVRIHSCWKWIMETG
jgi:hypothetical protein